MTDFDMKLIKRAAVTMLGTLILTTTAVTAAVGPAMAVETAPAAAVQMQVAGDASA